MNELEELPSYDEFTLDYSPHPPWSNLDDDLRVNGEGFETVPLVEGSLKPPSGGKMKVGWIQVGDDVRLTGKAWHHIYTPFSRSRDTLFINGVEYPLWRPRWLARLVWKWRLFRK